MKFFSKEGVELAKKKIRIHEEELKVAQIAAGEAAGVKNDWHDNPDYDEAMQKIDSENAAIASLKNDLKEAKIIIPEEQNQIVKIGSTVDIKIDDQNKQITIGAFGKTFNDHDLISYITPLGNTLLEMKVHEKKVLQINRKTSSVTVEKIYPPSFKYLKTIKEISDN